MDFVLGIVFAVIALIGFGISNAIFKIPVKKIQALYDHLSDILHTAIDNMGSTISDYRDSYGNSGNNQKFFRVYQRTGEPCVACATPISKTKIAGRGTHFCPKCQKVYK